MHSDSTEQSVLVYGKTQLCAARSDPQHTMHEMQAMKLNETVQLTQLQQRHETRSLRRKG